MALLPALPFPGLLYFSVMAFAVGEGIFNAALGALVFIAAPNAAQGQVQGGVRLTGAGGQRGGQLYARLGPAATFGTGAVLVFAALALLTSQRPGAQVQAAD
ncbi:hypothetical protein [Deinococcus hopiensis]|uniref:hypothetical protein n=1 Tax=Deinococcus hopiensis TaxID=309885 RepID=UPI001FECEE98|nr:hypothetical protein [Deinococcus hopiensis]